ncbi:6726_t:CDS:2 [Paraglomus brasilianum]|uniref:6726_t:CDS:1 n=1 Tax=Paraglomus brasilianum TaxID=144538 RepID=A0A9N9CMW1_9GLOM|nr:6726_t:CDS:2 [Paraglomus brasilianum]
MFNDKFIALTHKLINEIIIREQKTIKNCGNVVNVVVATKVTSNVMETLRRESELSRRHIPVSNSDRYSYENCGNTVNVIVDPDHQLVVTDLLHHSNFSHFFNE